MARCVGQTLPRPARSSVGCGGLPALSAKIDCNVCVVSSTYNMMMDEPAVVDEARSDESFDTFFLERFAELSRLAFLLTGSSAVGDEIAQDACEEVFRRWDDIEHPRAYARTAVVNGARAWGRRRARTAMQPVGSDRIPGVDAEALAVRAVLAELPQAEREVLVFRYYADLKVDDIAIELGIPVGTVKSHIHRGLARMHKELS
jgi:RNA polymerase sigma factor (sigma-70 family)